MLVRQKQLQVTVFCLKRWAGWERGGEGELGCVTEPGLHSARTSFFTDVNVAFQQSAHKVLLDDDNLLPLLHLAIEYPGREHKGLPRFLASSPRLLVIVSSASIHFCRNHIILYLRNHLIQHPNFTQKESRQMLRDSQAMVLFLSCYWNGLFIYSCHSLRLKKEPLKDLREPRTGVFLPPTSPFLSPFCFLHCWLK